MFPVLRKILVPSLAVLGSIIAIPSVAHADVHGPTVRVDHERGRFERERLERERAERERRERLERERIERERIEHARWEEHRLVCARAYASGAPRWRLREMNCAVR